MIPKFSIIIVNYNTKNLLSASLNSISNKFRQKSLYEIIIIDNNSTDGSVSYLEKLNSPNIKFIKSKTNLGFSKANNLAVKQALGKYLFFLNSDTIIKKIDLEKVDSFLNQNPDVGLIAPRLLNQDQSIQASCYQKQSLKNAVAEYWYGQSESFSKYYPKNKKPVSVDSVVGAAVFIPKKVFDQIGGWDERYFMYFEDLQLCKDIKKLGKKIIYSPNFQVVHLHGSSPHKSSSPSKHLIQSSKIFHGILKYYILYIILWLGQKISSH